MEVTLLVDLVKGTPTAWPRLETDHSYAVVGSARPLEDAWRIGNVAMVDWLAELYGLDRLDAYQLLSQTSLCPIANVCDPNYSVVTKVPKDLLPASTAYGGLHRHLRDLASGLRLR
jgi:acetamidase/formamidase